MEQWQGETQHGKANFSDLLKSFSSQFRDEDSLRNLAQSPDTFNRAVSNVLDLVPFGAKLFVFVIDISGGEELTGLYNSSSRTFTVIDETTFYSLEATLPIPEIESREEFLSKLRESILTSRVVIHFDLRSN